MDEVVVEALKKKSPHLESSKKEAEQVMAQFTIDGPSHPKWACVKNKVCMQIYQKSVHETVSYVENEKP